MSSKLEQVLNAIDQVNQKDPHVEVVNGVFYPKELLYSHRMTEQLLDYEDHPSEELQIAARGQHIKRWSVPREDYPMDRAGYLKWRTILKLMHGDLVGDIMTKNGYENAKATRVKNLLMKKDLKKDAETQTLEDVICLVFLQYYLDEFAAQKDNEKVIDILRKTWGKMSDRAQRKALTLNLYPRTAELIASALSLKP